MYAEPGSLDPGLLVGRDRQIEVVEAAYRAPAGAPAAAGVILHGEAGVGRTRLAREAAARLESGGCRPQWVTATRSAAAVPLAALLPLLGDQRPTSQLDAFGSLAARFAATPAARPVLVVDDAHLLDDASAAVLFQLAIARRAFLVMTVRAGEPAPDAVTALWTTEAAGRVEVTALTDAEVDTLLAAALTEPADPVSAREVRRLCAGSPMLLREVLRAGQETGSLRRDGGVWRWSGQSYVTARLVDVVRARIGPLPPALVPVGELLAYCGSLPVPMLEAVTSHDAVVEAERRGLVTVEQSGARMTARLAQPIYAGVLRAATPRSRDRRIWRSLATALAETPMKRRDDILLGAVWRQNGGLPTPPDHLLRAAGHAYRRLDLDLVERLAGLAQDAGGGPEAALLRAEVLTDRGRYAAAAEALPAESEVTAAELGRWQVTHDRIRYWGGTRSGWTPGPPAADGDPAAQAARAWLLLADGRTTAALQAADTALRAGDVGSATNRAAAGVLASAGLLGQQERVVDLLAPSLAAAHQTRERNPWGYTQVAVAGCLALLATGQLHRAAELGERCYRDMNAMGAEFAAGAAPVVGACAAIRGVVAKAQGRVGTALGALMEAAALLDGWPTYRLDRLYLAELAASYALAGDLDAARQRLDEADRRTADPCALLDPWVERARAWLTAAGGDLPGATRQALRAGSMAAATGQPTVEALALFDAARFGDTGDARDRLAQLAGELGLPVVSAMAEIATALRRADAAGLDGAAEVLAEHGQLLYAAEAAMAAHTRHAKAGRRWQAHLSLARSADLTRDCGDVHTHLLNPNRLDTALTSREMQVASLAAAGKSGMTIAAQLGLSTRTVNNYLGQAYQKLGISGRAQLREILGPGVRWRASESG